MALVSVDWKKELSDLDVTCVMTVLLSAPRDLHFSMLWDVCSLELSNPYSEANTKLVSMDWILPSAGSREDIYNIDQINYSTHWDSHQCGN